MAAIDDIEKLYVGYFNRAGDPAGVNFWVAQYIALGQTPAALAGIANSFSLTPEAQNLYSFLAAPLVGSPTSFLSSVYSNLFGRTDLSAPADVTGIAYWTAQLANPAISVGRIIVDIISGAQGNDALVVANKTSVAKAFTQQLVNTNTDFNLALAQSALAGVTSDAATATSKIAANNTAIAGAGGSGGTTFNLTSSVGGTADVFVGGGGEDIFNGVITGSPLSTTFSSVDNLDGGGGSGDKLNVLIDVGGAGLFSNGPINNIEIFNVRNLAGATTINFGNINGETAFNFDRGTAATTVINLAAGTTVGIVGDGLTALGASLIGFAGTEATSTLNISGGTGVGTGLVTYTGSAASAAATPTALTINSTGATNTIGGLTLGAGTTSLTINAASSLVTGALTAVGLSTITASGAAALVNLAGAPVAPSVTTIDASGLTAGGMTVLLGGGVTSFKGGAGNDTVTTTALGASASIDAGTGAADRVNIAATADVNTAAKAAQYKGFDVLNAGGNTVKLDDFTASTITSVLVGGGDAILNAMNATQAGAVTVFADDGAGGAGFTFNVTGAGVSGSDVLNLTINDGVPGAAARTIDNITAPFVETINFAVTDNLTLTSMTGATGFTGSTITGTGNVSITTGGLALTSNSTFFNASAVGGLPGGTVTINASGATAFGVSITGSSTYVNTLTGTALADTLVGGAGNDFLTNRAAGAATAADLMTGGAGQDTFTLFGSIASAAVAVPGAYNGASRITDFGVTTASTTTDILALSATFGNYTGISSLVGVAAGAAGTTTVQSLASAAGAVAVTAGADLIKLTTGVNTAALPTLQVAFNTAITGSSITGLGAGNDIFVSFYDTTNSRAVILAVETFAGTDGTLESADVVNLIGTINMSAADYATFGTNQLAIVA